MRVSLSMLALAALSVGARSQDSVSLVNGLPGDAIDPRSSTEQINDYVVDLGAFRSSWGKTFAVGPIAKASQQRNNAPLFFTGLINAQAYSRRLASAVPFLRGQYALWNGPGLGVNGNPARNTAPGSVATLGFSGFQAGFAFGEFADGDPAGTNLAVITSGILNYTSARPSRLYVSRITAATNSASDSCSSAAFGMGAVDESGNVHFRADGFGAIDPCGGLSAFSGNNLFRVRAASRTGVLNALSSSFPVGAEPAATDHLLVNSSTIHNVPNAVPSSVAGRPLLIGSNFARQYVFEQSAGGIVAGAANAHLAGLADHRGAVGYTTRSFPGLFPGSPNGTAAIVGGALGTAGIRDSLALWGVAANGNLVLPIARALPAPAAGLDPDEPGWAPTAPQEFDHYHSQTAFQGGSAQVALGQDQAGNLVAAGTVYYGFVPPAQISAPFDNPRNYIAVARIDPLTGATTWRAAAWTDGVAGKKILQNGTTVIGNLRPFATGRGPCLSAPMIDSVGNVWFLGSFERAANPGSVSVGLFRSVWQPSPASYRLELVLAQGDVFRGQNSTRDYVISFLTLNDSDSISTGSAWSGNIAEVADRGMSTVGLATDDARTLGGIVVSASIVYDNNADGQFVRSTGTNGTPGSPDEDYNVLLYVAASADCDNDGIPDDREIAEGTGQDLNGNGIVDACEGFAGVLFCFGDGSGTACPCGNASLPADQVGCLSSLGTGGRLRASGNSSLSSDTIVLAGSQMPNSSALYFQGTSQQSGGLGAALGDGLRCAGGSVVRLGTKPNQTGTSQYPVGADLPVSTKGLVTAPGSRTYQVWYRNAAAFCTSSTFNLSNGVQLTWTP
ncbi:MAG: hypothetical protein NTY35_00565 [Planctomycetota bacterium]|nr:hypothetical protein [Planctomycetota bacterium]